MCRDPAGICNRRVLQERVALVNQVGQEPADIYRSDVKTFFRDEATFST